MAKPRTLPPGTEAYRALLLRESEVVNALTAFRRALKDPLPPGRILGVQCEPRTLRVVLIVANDEGGERRIDFDAGEIAAALTAFCADARNRVQSGPVPPGATASFRMIAGRPAFLIRETGGAPPDDVAVAFNPGAAR